ncbi:hypothetical protein [Desulfosarcina alkanivorans]|nr:hypothetical protein [Desulfosarcina alkanivorans]
MHVIAMETIVKCILMGLCLQVGIGFESPCHAAQKIVLAGSQDTQEVPQMKWLVLIYTEAFRRLGYELQYDIYPLARLTMMVDAGEVDGEIQRPGEYQAAHQNLIRVDESPASVRYGAYTVKPGIVLQGWNSLKNTSYRVEYRLGASRSEAELKSVVNPGNLSQIAKTEQGLKKLILGRTDVFVDLEHNITNTVKRLDRADFDTSAVYQAGLMQETAMYAYLHKKHSALVPKLASVLKAMKQEGLIEQYRKIALKEE